MSKAAVLSLAILAVFGFVLGLCAIGSGATWVASASAPQAGTCVTSGPLSGLSPDAAANARTVTAVAARVGGSEAALIAVTVGITESDLRILGNPSVNTTGFPTQGIGTNFDSVGIFQQRASWGTVAQRLDPVTATGLFVTRLLDDPGWQTKPVWVAAQDVQQSAFDGQPRLANGYSSVYGENYAGHAGQAAQIVSVIERDSSGLACGSLSGGEPASSVPGSHGLPADYTIPATATLAESQVVAFAISQLDKPYVFGAAGPESFDCSGLTMAAWAAVGMALPHSTVAQASAGTPTAVGVLVPGDLVLVPGDDGSLAAPGHVGLYIGKGLVLNAADELAGIRVQTYDNFLAVGHGLSALRHIA
jgi:cell wall-associated NlpC family hydrolase